MDKTTKEILIFAKEAILRDGWCQGQAMNHYGNRCALGALSYAHDTIGYSHGAYAALVAALPGGHGNIAPWNDVPGRTLEEVLALFDRAIAAEDVK